MCNSMTDEAGGMKAQPGTYLLFLAVDARRRVRVGKLGEMTVRPGVYAYVGSARGPGGVRARVQRHARADKTLHWHIDYLRSVTRFVRVWYVLDGVRHECMWADAMAGLPDAQIPMHGFGASDCACTSHLFHLPDVPPRTVFEQAVRHRVPSHPAIKESVPRSSA